MDINELMSVYNYKYSTLSLFLLLYAAHSYRYLVFAVDPLPYMGIDELMRVYNYSGYSGWNNCPCFCSACCCCCCAHVYGIKVCLCLYVYV